jgi:protease II
VLTVPSLDVLATALEDDDSLDELGDVVRSTAAYEAVRMWSPMDNLPGPGAGVRTFPDLLVRVGLSDTVVDFWDPAKYVAKLRHAVAGHGAGGAVEATDGMRQRQPWVLLQVKSGGHNCFSTESDEAVKCAFFMHCLEQVRGKG